jgi:pimeloyl-ACP methyl ester carboxylesterase
MRRRIALGAVAAALTTMITTTTGITEAATPVEFSACPQEIAEPFPELRCATVPVPLDHSRPGGEQIDVMISRLPATDLAKRRGVLLLNGGGPGAPGLHLPGALGPRFSPAVREMYDLIGFDPRGVGFSEAMRCLDDPAAFFQPPLPDPDAVSNRTLHWARAKKYADACNSNAHKLLPHLTTRDQARDLERIRIALGERKISYVGYSAGAYLGAVYGELFPYRVDRMIMDSNVDATPRQLWYRAPQAQTVAVVRRQQMFFDWVATYDDVFGLGATGSEVRAVWESLVADLRRSPHGPIGAWEIIEDGFNSLYSEGFWIPLAGALSDYVNRQDDTALLEVTAALGDRTSPAADNFLAAFTAMTCGDSPTPREHAVVERDIEALAENSPFAWFNHWYSACSDWPIRPAEPVRITGRALPPVLMVNSVFDMATPYEGALRTHRLLPSSILVTEKDAGRHGVFVLARNPNVDAIGTDYLVSGRLPATDISVPGHALPNPRPGATTTSAELELPHR